MRTIYVKLCELSRQLGLPEASIKRFALEGKIPSLKLKKGLRFNPAAVSAALDKLASDDLQGRGDNVKTMLKTEITDDYDKEGKKKDERVKKLLCIDDG